MYTLYQPNLPGYGLFSVEGLLTILGCFLILNALQPASLIAARLADFVQGTVRFGANRSTVLRGLDTSSSATIGGAYLLQGEARVPAYAIFALAISHQMLGTNAAVLQSLQGETQTVIAAVGAMSLFSFTAFFDHTPVAWNTLFGSHLMRLAYIISFGAIGYGFYTSGFQVTWLISIVACCFSVRIISLLLTRGVWVFGLGSIIWSPIMIISWAAMSCVGALLGPFMGLFDRLLDAPGFDGIKFGRKRESQIVQADISAPRCFSLDGALGMKKPA